MDDHHNDEVCDTNLQLGLVHGYDVPKRDNQQKRKHVFFLDLSVPQQSDDECTDSSSSLKILGADHDENEKRKNGICYGIDGDAVGNGNCFKNISTKKLRLTRDQTTLLEDSFKQRPTPNTVKKQELAEKLNLKPRQVEVWFQNRRARTKMKQTELDCKVLKKNCERLAAENRRLKEDLLELKSAMKIEDSSHAAGCAAVFLKTCN